MHLLVLLHITWTREGNWMVRPDPRHTKGANDGRDNSVSLRDASLVGRVVHCPRGWRDSARRICYSAARCHPFYFSRGSSSFFFFFLHSSQHQVPPWTRKEWWRGRTEDLFHRLIERTKPANNSGEERKWWGRTTRTTKKSVVLKRAPLRAAGAYWPWDLSQKRPVYIGDSLRWCINRREEKLSFRIFLSIPNDGDS